MLILFLLLLGVCDGYVTARNQLYIDGWTMTIMHAKCSGTDAAVADTGDDASNTIESCARQCDIIGSSCVAFGFLQNNANRCQYYTSACNLADPQGVGSNVVYGTHINHGIFQRNSDLNDYLLKEHVDFDGYDNHYRCTSNGRIGADRGYENRATLEACLKTCFEVFPGQCVGVTYRVDSGSETQSRCYYNNKGCRKYTSLRAYEAASGWDTYWVKGHYQEPSTTTTEAKNHYNNGNFDLWTILGCPIKRIIWSSTTEKKANARGNCPSFDTPGVDGILNTSGYVYDKTFQDIDVCGQECYDWNHGANTSDYECRSFNMELENDSSDSFRCTLYSCDLWTREASRHFDDYDPGTSNNDYDTWGFMDNLISTECAGNFITEQRTIVKETYDVHLGTVCGTGSTQITSYDHCSISAAHQYCFEDWENCAAIYMNSGSRVCQLYSKCVLETSANAHKTVFLRNKFTRMDNSNVTNVELFENAECATSVPGSVLATHSDVAYTVTACIEKCDNTTNCKYMEINDSNHCVVMDNTCSPNSTSSTHTVYRKFNPGETPAPTPPITAAPTVPPECTASTDCIANITDVCTDELECETIPCTSHVQCYDSNLFLPNRLPFCNLKKKYCEDLFSSQCGSRRRCRSQARRKWRKQRALSRASIRNQEARADKRREAAERAVSDAQTMVAELSTDKTVYIGVIGSESVEIDSGTISLVSGNETLLYNSIMENYCGTATIGCNYTVDVGPSRRLLMEYRELQDENVTITITYDLDDELYQDLLDSGHEFGSDNLTQAIADDLGLNASDVTVVDVNGTIEIEITIVDDTADGEAIGDELIDDIDTIQEQLDNITQTLIDDLGANSTTVLLDEVDYCGDRGCSSQGTCNATSGYCDCNDGYQGINCEIQRICNLTSGFCLNGGNCSDDGMQCHCVYPYAGNDCSEIVNCGC